MLNTVVLAMDHHPMDDEFSLYLEVFNFAFSLCFMLEMALKASGYAIYLAYIYVLPQFLLSHLCLYLVNLACFSNRCLLSLLSLPTRSIYTFLDSPNS